MDFIRQKRHASNHFVHTVYPPCAAVLATATPRVVLPRLPGIGPAGERGFGWQRKRLREVARRRVELSNDETIVYMNASASLYSRF